MKASYPDSVTPQAHRLVKKVLKEIEDPVKLKRALFNLQCYIHRLEVKAGSMTEPQKEKDNG